MADRIYTVLFLRLPLASLERILLQQKLTEIGKS